MTSALHFLKAARQCEIAELEQLQRTSALVDLLGRLIHALQKERGLSCVYLTSHDTPAALAAQIADCERLARDARAGFDRLDTPAQGARLLSRIAYVLQGMDALPLLRQRIHDRHVSPEAAAAALTKLVAGLLAVVFEAADSAADPGISRLLVALFHFLQGKELAGQERATGVAAFGACMDTAAAQRQQHWLHLIAAQERCFQVFAEFAPPTLLPLWRAEDAALERLRRVGCTAAAPDATLSQTWFDTATHRMDALHAIETQLAAELLYQCEQRIAQAREPLPAADASTDFFDAAAPAASLGPQLNRSVLELVQEQSQRLQAMQAELETARAALNERKLVERAKGLLMARRQLSEGEAHKLLRQTAMHQGRKLAEVAEAVLAMADLLPPAPH